MKPQFAILSLVVACQFLSACSGSGQGTNKSPLAPQLQEMGTGDGGGGNAIDYKMLESHLINPMDLDIVKYRLHPMFEKIFNNEENKTTYKYFDMKNWYLAPIKLKSIPKEVLGIEFTADRHQQVAIQTENAIWIDSDIFGKMNNDEKARLLAHEVLMSIYLTRFATIEKLCATIERTSGYDCKGFAENIGKLPQYQPEPKRNLNESDYEKIRAMTAWLFRNESDLSADKYEKKAKQVGFTDKRFFYRGDIRDEVEISQKDLMLELEKARLSGRLMNTCKAIETQETFNCEVSWKYEDQAYPGYKEEYVVFTIKDATTKKVIQSSKVRTWEKQTHHLSPIAENIYFMPLIPIEFARTQKSGYQESIILFTFEIDRAGKLNFKNLLFSPRTVVKSITYEEKNEGSDIVLICEKRVLVQTYAKNLETDQLFVNTYGSDDLITSWAKVFRFDESTICNPK